MNQNLLILFFFLVIPISSHCIEKAAFDKANEADMDWHIAQMNKAASNQCTLPDHNYGQPQQVMEGPRTRELDKLSAGLTNQILKTSPDKIKKIVAHFSQELNFYTSMRPKKLMLFGPSGTGKTTIARAMASAWNVPIFYYGACDIANQYYASWDVNLRAIFDKAKNLGQPCVIVIDEIQEMIKKSQNDRADDSSMLTQFWLNLDTYAEYPIFVIVTLNHAKKIPDTMLTRFKNCIQKIDLPTPGQRRDIIKYYLFEFETKCSVNCSKLLNDDGALNQLIRPTHGLSNRDIEAALRIAAADAFDRNNKNPILTLQDCFIAIKEDKNISFTEPRPLTQRIIKFIKPSAVSIVLTLMSLGVQIYLTNKQVQRANQATIPPVLETAIQPIAQKDTLLNPVFAFFTSLFPAGGFVIKPLMGNC